MIYYISHFPLIIPQKDCDSEFLKLLKYVKPEWPSENIKIKYFNKGTTNTIISASLQPISEYAITAKLRNQYNLSSSSSQSSLRSEDLLNSIQTNTPQLQTQNPLITNTTTRGERHDLILDEPCFENGPASQNLSNDRECGLLPPPNPEVVLIRIYGNKTEVIIDRKKEIENIVAMWSIDCGSELYCSFTNGLCYEYAHGITVSTRNVRHPRIYPKIAHKLAQMHSSFLTYRDLPRVELIPVDLTTDPSVESDDHNNLNMARKYFIGLGRRLSSTFTHSPKHSGDGNEHSSKNKVNDCISDSDVIAIRQTHSPMDDRVTLISNTNPLNAKHGTEQLNAENSIQENIVDKDNEFPAEPIPCYFPTIKKWASLILPFLEDGHNRRKSLQQQAGSSQDEDNAIAQTDKKSLLLSQLPVDPWAEIEYLEETLLPLNSPIVYCHNDLLLDNIIFNPQRNSLLFIDLEYGDFNFQAFDIAHFFCEFAGLEVVDYDLFPTREFRRKWLAIYLKEWKKLSVPKKIYEKYPSLDELLAQVDKFILAPHLYWGVWAILQSQVSEISFDYFNFAKIRLNEYARIKNDPAVLMR